MTEEQVKQIIVDMISSGELEFKTKKTLDIFEMGDKTVLDIHHNKDGYKKIIYQG